MILIIHNCSISLQQPQKKQPPNFQKNTKMVGPIQQEIKSKNKKKNENKVYAQINYYLRLKLMWKNINFT